MKKTKNRVFVWYVLNSVAKHTGLSQTSHFLMRLSLLQKLSLRERHAPQRIDNAFVAECSYSPGNCDQIQRMIVLHKQV